MNHQLGFRSPRKVNRTDRQLLEDVNRKQDRIIKQGGKFLSELKLLNLNSATTISITFDFYTGSKLILTSVKNAEPNKTYTMQICRGSGKDPRTTTPSTAVPVPDLILSLNETFAKNQSYQVQALSTDGGANLFSAWVKYE